MPAPPPPALPAETPAAAAAPRRRWPGRLGRGLLRLLFLVVVLVALTGLIGPPTTLTILREGTPGRRWVPAEAIAPDMLRAVVAAEDAGFCRHWGFDMAEIRRAIAQGSTRGASTLSQQVTKNVFLWQGRSWVRKALEAGLTPLVEATWSKRRILEVYLNVAEFGPGIFGVAQAAERHYGTTPARLSLTQAARLAAVLPAPKRRDPHDPALARRAAAIADGARTIEADGRDACFLPRHAAAGAGAVEPRDSGG